MYIELTKSDKKKYLVITKIHFKRSNRGPEGFYTITGAQFMSIKEFVQKNV